MARSRYTRRTTVAARKIRSSIGFLLEGVSELEKAAVSFRISVIESPGGVGGPVPGRVDEAGAEVTDRVLAGAPVGGERQAFDPRKGLLERRDRATRAVGLRV